LLVGQRLFAGGRWPEAEALAVLRALARRRALVLTLARMGLDDPASYRAALGRADALDRLDGKEREPAAAAYQAALALVERSRFARVLEVDAARALVLSLSALEPPTGTPQGCAVARWVEGELGGRLRVVLGPSPGPVERLLARAVSGDVPAARPPVIE